MTYRVIRYADTTAETGTYVKDYSSRKAADKYKQELEEKYPRDIIIIEER